MSDFTEFFLNRAASVRPLDLLEISHPNFSRPYYIVRNARYGVTVVLETSVEQFFEFYPLQIKGIAANQNLDQVLEVQLGDLGDLLQVEIDNIAAANGFLTKPVCKYRRYRSDDLSAPIEGPIVFEIPNVTFNSQGSAFQAQAPQVNNNKTGEIYTYDRFPMLRGM